MLKISKKKEKEREGEGGEKNGFAPEPARTIGLLSTRRTSTRPANETIAHANSMEIR